MNKTIKSVGTAALTLAMLAACSSQPANTEAEFGKAVRSVTMNQIYDIGSATNPSSDAVTGGHPDRLENVVKSHAGHVGDAGKVQVPVRIGTGSSN